MQTAPMLPSTAPFAEEQIAALNRVISVTTAEQRAWLSGFLAGLQAANDPQAAAPSAPPAKRVPLTILFGTESGNAEALAAQARKAAAKLGFSPKVVDMADLTLAQAAATENLLIVASTWGEGDPPQRAMDFYEGLLADDAPRFETTRYAVLALGDRAYARFCEIGRRIDERLAALGGARVADRIECDLDYEIAATGWIDATLERLNAETGSKDTGASVIHVDFARPGADTATRARPFEAEITEHIRLSGSRSTSDTHHVALSLEGSGIVYEPGDLLGVIPSNDPALADALLAAAGLTGDAVLRGVLIERLDITTLTPKQVEDFARLTGIPEPPDGWAMGRQVIDLIETAPGKLSAEQLTTLLRPLPPRYYSIASSRRTVGDEAHLLVAGLRYTSHGRERAGVASVDITARHRDGDRLRVFLRPNPHFRLPADASRPVIMVGPGTGVAPFRGFLQEREAVGAPGRNWLMFGHRNYLHDFLYQLEWQDWLKGGLLTRLDVAFSRDQPEKQYVQNTLWSARRDLYAWLKDGAALYVCGDANAMAKDVHAILLLILADQGHQDEAAAKAELDTIRRDGRYLRDVIKGVRAMAVERPLSPNEGIKQRSNLLRGTIADGLGRVETGSLAEDDTQLTKFHGIYQQDDRDLRAERGRQRMEKAFSFMARMRVPGGILTPTQWLAAEKVALERGNGTLRLTTRQTIQFHGILKGNLRPLMQGLNDAMLDTIAACGDVNRNVIATTDPWRRTLYASVSELARDIATHLLPHSRAWHEIWLEGEKVAGGVEEDEPIYGRTYMPRKFKIAVALPPHNDVDVFAHDLGFIAIEQRGKVIGYNVVVGGGMGMTHGEPDTYPRTGDVIGFCKPGDALDVAEKVVTIQRDHGDRSDRKHARLKYTIGRMGLENFVAALHERLAIKLAPARPFAFISTGDRLGWAEERDGTAHFILFVENGRVRDLPQRRLLSGLRAIAELGVGRFIMTPNQNLVLADIPATHRHQVETLLADYGLDTPVGGLRRSSMACVALPTCGLALAESERYLPDLVSRLEAELERLGLRNDEITIRMTGCPNGCARPYVSEIGLVGRTPGIYNLYLGGAHEGVRLNKLHRRDVDGDAIVAALSPLFEAYARERSQGERFGNYVIRTGVVQETRTGIDFHANLSTEAEN